MPQTPKMKFLTLLILSCLSIAVYGQDTIPPFDGHKWKAPYTLPIPKDWGIERFLIPIGFAPEIPYRGVEDIRFAPGWAKAKDAAYWSYAFLWYLEGGVKMDARTVENNLKAYYTGLIAVNGRNIPAEKLIPVVTSFKETRKERGDLQTYAGTITMLDYMAQKTITLHCRVHLKSCPGRNKTFVFHELSPRPFSHKIWLALNKLWLGFRCNKE